MVAVVTLEKFVIEPVPIALGVAYVLVVGDDLPGDRSQNTRYPLVDGGIGAAQRGIGGEVIGGEPRGNGRRDLSATKENELATRGATGLGRVVERFHPAPRVEGRLSERRHRRL